MNEDSKSLLTLSDSIASSSDGSTVIQMGATWRRIPTSKSSKYLNHGAPRPGWMIASDGTYWDDTEREPFGLFISAVR